ncbi:MAG: ribbon-helix-helix domain-containing protein, partial [Alphaproteobacteria bacterium]|nr:ribbon-helix-helix domain-containing protein [Alphaproteobacteria bacterium]
MKKLSVSLSGHQTSVSLEPEFFDVLQKLAIQQNKSVASIIKSIDESRNP